MLNVKLLVHHVTVGFKRLMDLYEGWYEGNVSYFFLINYKHKYGGIYIYQR